MANLVQDVMSPDPVIVDAKASLERAAEVMRTHSVGDVLVIDEGVVRGILTDRDIVIRAVAEGKAPAATLAGQCCSEDPKVVSVDASTDQAVELMRRHALRRLPVVNGDQLVGVISIGDLAVSEDGRSALADISAAMPNV